MVLQEDQSLEDGRAIAEELMVSLGVACDELLSGAYMDMILEGQLKDSKNMQVMFIVPQASSMTHCNDPLLIHSVAYFLHGNLFWFQL